MYFEIYKKGRSNYERENIAYRNITEFERGGLRMGSV
jgi:hypothetical protein